MASSLPFVYQDFSGGLNTKTQAFLLADNQARDLLNVQGTSAGAITKRTGLVTFSSPADTFTSLFAFEEGVTFLVGAGSTKLYKVTTGGTASTIKTGLTANVPWEFVQGPASGSQGPLFGMNGTDTPQQWDGSASTTGDWTAASGSVPNGTMCVNWANSVWVSGVAAHSSRVYWSALGDPRTWPSTNVVDLDPNDGEPITGMGVVGPYLLVGKRHKLYVIYDAATGANRQISNSVGIASHRSVANGPPGTYFLAEDRGVYVTNGAKVTALSDPIQPTIDGLVPGQKKVAAGSFFQGHYYLSVCDTGTTNNKTLDYDTTLNSWWLHSIASNQFATWHPSVGGQLYSAKSSSAIVDQCFTPATYTDNGSNMSWVWRGPWQSPSFYRRRRFPTPYFRKRWRQVRIEGQGTVDFSVATDFAAAEVLWRADIFKYASASDVFEGSGLWGADGTYGGTPMVRKANMYTLGAALAKSMVFSATSSSLDTVQLYDMQVVDRRDGMAS